MTTRRCTLSLTMIGSAMQSVFQLSPKDWQCSMLAFMCNNPSSHPLLLLRPTGEGKSAVRNAFSVITGGVSLTITPLLSLSADQVQKIQAASQIDGPVVFQSLWGHKNPQKTSLTPDLWPRTPLGHGKGQGRLRLALIAW